MADPGSSSSKAHRAKCCDICGDTGTHHALITCSGCKDSCQHLYCMRTLQLEHPKTWLCEDCNPEKNKVSKEPVGNASQRLHQGSNHSKVFPNLRRQNYISSFKDANSGKTKLLSDQDAIHLAEGSSNPHIVVKRSVCRSASLKNNAAAPAPVKPDRSPAHVNVVARKESAPSYNGFKGNDSEGQRQNSRTCRDANGTKMVLGKSPLGFSSATEEKSPSSALDKGKSPLRVPSATTVRTGSAVSRGVVLQQSRVPVKRTPWAAASWSGSCRVYNASQQLEAIHKFQAHPPSRVLKKVYDFSKSMPDLLQFELTPRRDVWVDVDQQLCRDKRDIGLYFFPANKERRDSYDQLLEVMITKDFAMRTRVYGMELVIFTSRVLSSNCQKWGGRHFLWGLFRKVGKPPQEEVDMSEDMDIDMVGGEEIPGKQDHVVPPARPPHVPPPAHTLHVPPAPPLKRVKTEEQEGCPLPPPPPPPAGSVPPPAAGSLPPPPPLPAGYVPQSILRRLQPEDYLPPAVLRRVKAEEMRDCPPGFERH